MREFASILNTFENFYMWFDLEEKKSIMQHPLYLYQVEKEIKLIQMMKQNSI